MEWTGEALTRAGLPIGPHHDGNPLWAQAVHRLLLDTAADTKNDLLPENVNDNCSRFMYSPGCRHGVGQWAVRLG